MDNQDWIELAIESCNHAKIPYQTIETIATWDQMYCANAVYRLGGQRYLKIYSPSAERQFHIERCVLRALNDQTAIPAPRIVAEGERTHEPSYLVMTEIPGATAENVWDSLARTHQLALARDFGSLCAAIHRLPMEALATVEQKYGGRHKHIQGLLNQRTAEIMSIETLSLQQRDDLLSFLHVEAQEHIDHQQNLTHFDLAHNHIYLSQDVSTWHVTGIIDWGEAMIGPPEWDVAYLWFWTFTCDRDAMQACLQTLYMDRPLPARFARRCMAAVMYTSSMSLLWDQFAKAERGNDLIVRELVKCFFPPDVFGPPD